MDDLRIKREVEVELEYEPSVNAARIGVAVKDGIVTLLGLVSSIAEKDAAGRTAARVAGVKAVVNELEVSVPPADQRTDEEIARAVAEALASHSSVPPGQVKAQVSQGWVTLEGSVIWHYQREAAEQAVRQLRGVKGVINKIVLKPTARADMVQARIEAALRRIAELDAQRITVENHITVAL